MVLEVKNEVGQLYKQLMFIDLVVRFTGFNI